MIYVLTVIYENSELKLFDSATEKFKDKDKDKAFKRFNELIDKCRKNMEITVEKVADDEYSCIDEQETTIEIKIKKINLYKF